MQNYKKDKPRQCVYCSELGELTKDHIPPKSLFSQPRPTTLITVPACQECHKLLSKDDEYLRDIFVLTYPTGKQPEAQKLLDKTLRSFKRKEKARFTRNLFQDAVPISINDSPTAAIHVQATRIYQQVERFIIGLFYKEKGCRLADEHYPMILFNPFSTNMVKRLEYVASLFDQKSTVIGEGVFSYQVKFLENNPNDSLWLLWFFRSQPFICATPAAGRLLDNKNME